MPKTSKPKSIALTVPFRKNEKLKKVVARINANVTIKALWRVSNITAIDRLMLTDHGPVHVKVVANIALKMLRILMKAGIEPGVCKHHDLSEKDAEVVVLLAAALHDIGHSIHRERHELLSIALASQYIPALLDGIYDEETTALIMAETLHAISAHQKDVQGLSIEAGVLCVADALDMEQGRARIPFEAGSTSIHAVSATAIEKLLIDAGSERPIRIEITMENPAGMFQVDYLLKQKVRQSGIADYMEIYVNPLTGKLDRRRVW